MGDEMTVFGSSSVDSAFDSLEMRAQGRVDTCNALIKICILIAVYFGGFAAIMFAVSN